MALAAVRVYRLARLQVPEFQVVIIHFPQGKTFTDVRHGLFTLPFAQQSFVHVEYHRDISFIAAVVADQHAKAPPALVCNELPHYRTIQRPAVVQLVAAKNTTGFRVQANQPFVLVPSLRKDTAVREINRSRVN